MYIIIWEYQVKADHTVEFEKIYSADGDWAKLFRKKEGYLGTELLRDPDRAHRYMTIDRWASANDYETFLSYWKTEYENLDSQCDGLADRETLLGRWETVSTKTR